jgi:hypothetical protein
MAGQLGQDPTYLAWLRALGFEENTARSDATAGRERVQSQVDYAQPRILEEGVRERRDISYGMEDRGLFRSGEALRRGAEQRADEQYRIGGLQIQAGEQLAGIESGLARELAGIERRRAEQALTTGGDIYRREGLIPYRNY